MKDPGVILFAAGTARTGPIEPVRDALLAAVEGWPQPVTRKNSSARVRMRNAYEKTLNDPAPMA
jgi:zinc protease